VIALTAATDASETRRFAIRLAKAVARDRRLPWPRCYAEESLQADGLRFELRRRLRRDLPGLTPGERELLIEDVT